jgi:hypothetical protein
MDCQNLACMLSLILSPSGLHIAGILPCPMCSYYSCVLMDMLNRNSMALIHMCMAVQLYCTELIAGIARGFSHTSAVFMSLRVARQTWQVLDANFLPLVRKILTMAVLVLYTFTVLAFRQNWSWPTTETERS